MDDGQQDIYYTQQYITTAMAYSLDVLYRMLY